MPFQFHKGTIRTGEHKAKSSAFAHFNSIKVQLELNGTDDYPFFLSYFNSIKVQLERDDEFFSRLWLENFNSIKVQLEPITCLKLEACTEFQFHKGTIRTDPASILSPR